MNCNYKVKITDIQTKYKFKVFCTGYDDSEIKEKIDAMYQAWPKAPGEGETPTLDNTANATMTIDLKGNTSQEGTPTPTSPQDIHVVKGDNEIIVSGHNLFNKATIIEGKYIDGIGNFVSASDNFIGDFIPINSANNYYISSNNAQPKRIAYYDNSNTFISRELISATGGTLTIPTNAYYLRLSCYNVDLNSLQLEYGTTKTTYQSFNGLDTYNIDLPEGMELCKIGDYQDSIVKDNGKWYLNKQIGKVVLNGSETGWSFTSGSVWKYRINISNAMFTISYASKPLILSNYYTAVLWNSSTNYQMSSLLDLPSTLAVRNDDITTLDNWKTWLSTHNTIVYYPLATSTYTEITDSTLISQLNTLANAESYSGQTNISQTNDDKPFILTAKALKDLSNL